MLGLVSVGTGMCWDGYFAGAGLLGRVCWDRCDGAVHWVVMGLVCIGTGVPGHVVIERGKHSVLQHLTLYF